ncbi:MAG: glycosyltransferase, partial [Persicimonas sp.]
FDLSVCTFWGEGYIAREVEKLGVDVHILGVDPAIRNPRATVALYRFLSDLQPDILHSSIAEANFHGAIAGALAGVPARIVEEVGVPTRSELAHRIMGAIYATTQAVVGVSQATCDYLIERENAPADRVRRVYNCVRPAFLEEGIEPSLPPTDRFRVLAVGRLVPVKNHKGFLRAFRRVVDANPQVELKLAGDGPLRGDLEALVEELELGEHVELLGFRDDVRELLASADCFVLPSFSEGLSISLVEALAMRRPPLVSRVGGNPEVVGKLDDSLLLEPDDTQGWADAILSLAELDAEERAEIGERARRVVEDYFSPTVYTRTLESLYESRYRATPHRSPSLGDLAEGVKKLAFPKLASS